VCFVAAFITILYIPAFLPGAATEVARECVGVSIAIG
jgi:hypothetical protein